jgi:regulator of protease activity HflC (stomatin/prohibitin superfamily)
MEWKVMNEHQSVKLNGSRERPAKSLSGYIMLVPLVLALAYVVWAGMESASEENLPSLPGTTVALLVMAFTAAGFYKLQPNQGAAITFFGAYSGTDRKEGLRWIFPWMSKKKVSLRSNNLISETIKINDLRGNPIEIAAQVVWRVTDTAQALFDVDDYKAFVLAQIEAAVRTIGSRYPYDDIEHKEVALRSHHEEVGIELRQALMERLTVAGITVDECGLTHLAYAPEIAGLMLRRQQAQSVVAARQTLVEGAVGMVEMALARLSERKIVKLDDERKAAMVSNLLVVLCGEREAQPVVNTGTLYQ